jgi:hypothetical protein
LNLKIDFIEVRALAILSGALLLQPPMLQWNSLEKQDTNALLVHTLSLLLDL